jgi:hypothetical protein
MKRIGLGIALTLLVTILVASMAMADGPGNNGYGADPGADRQTMSMYLQRLMMRVVVNCLQIQIATVRFSIYPPRLSRQKSTR